MAQAVATVPVVDRGYKVLAEGLVITRALSRPEWQTLGRHLAAVAHRTLWAIGDWLVYGSGRGDYGAYYHDAALITGGSLESLSQLARVSQAFPLGSRTLPVPWSFYREALRLPEQDRARALHVATANRWTRDDLADFIKGRDDPATVERLTAPAATRATARPGWHRPRAKNHHKVIQCPSCGFKFEPRRRWAR